MEYLAITDDLLYLAVAHSQDDALLKDRKHAAGNFVEGRVCGHCNNGWMRDLEEQTRELLKPLAAPLQKVPPLDQMRYIKDKVGAIPPRVEVFGQQWLATGDFRQIQRNQWRHIAGTAPKHTSPPEGSYKIAFQFRCLMLLVAYWSGPAAIPMISAGIHIPLWPIHKLHITYHEQLPPLNMNNPMAPLDRFCSTLAVADLDAFIPFES